MRVALAQINTHLGDFSGNSDKVLSYINKAKERRCDLVVFPELTLFGYIPQDLLERESVVDAQLKELSKLKKKLPKGIAALVGVVTKNTKKDGKPFFNSVVCLEKGKKDKYFHKELLPTYDVFDEARHMAPGDNAKNILKYKGKKILITICEDIWAWPIDKKRNSIYLKNPIKKHKSKDVDYVVNLSSSPFTRIKKKLRKKNVKLTAQYLKAPMVYVNQVGAQDEIIYDGGSFAVDKKGKVICQSSYFSEDINVIDLKKEIGGARKQEIDKQEFIRQALVLGIRDFVNKIGLKNVHFGLSGGVDSALVACLAVDALGPNRVKAFALPGPYSSDLSYDLAKELANNLGIELKNININSTYNESLKTFENSEGGLEFSLVQENLQARIRGLMLMAFSNLEGSLLLNTSNKSEVCVGYSTMYGDTCGGLAPIADLLKTEVYTLCDHYNKNHEVIPKKILTREPSAELRPNQKDSDSLPAYAELDKSINKLVVKGGKATSKVDKKVLQLMHGSEFKRWQFPPILKISQHAFGSGRRFPITHEAKY